MCVRVEVVEDGRVEREDAGVAADVAEQHNEHDEQYPSTAAPLPLLLLRRQRRR